MGSFNRHQYFRFSSTLQPRVHSLLRQAQSLFRSTKSENPLKRERVKALWSALGLLVGSCILGVWAHEMTQTESLLRWEKSHLPSTYIVQKSLQTLGFFSVSDFKKVTRLLRSLSLSTDESGGFWVSTDHHWVAYYGEDPTLGNELRFQFYCKTDQALQNSSSPLSWMPLNRGWKGLEEVLKVLEKKGAPPLSVKEGSFGPKRGKKPVFRDPREIIY